MGIERFLHAATRMLRPSSALLLAAGLLSIAPSPEPITLPAPPKLSYQERTKTVLDEIFAEAPYGINPQCMGRLTESFVDSVGRIIDDSTGEDDMVVLEEPDLHIVHMTAGYLRTDTALICSGSLPITMRNRKTGKTWTKRKQFLGAKAHFYVDTSGVIWPAVPFTRSSNNAGISYWEGRDHLSRYSIATEVEGMSCPNDKQYEVIRFLDEKIKPLGITQTVSHSMVAYMRRDSLSRAVRDSIGDAEGRRGRKQDGLCYDWSRITGEDRDELADPDVQSGRIAPFKPQTDYLVRKEERKRRERELAAITRSYIARSTGRTTVSWRSGR